MHRCLPLTGRSGCFTWVIRWSGATCLQCWRSWQGTDIAYDSQLGWGTSLREHWEPDLPINGFDAENDHPRFRPARDAIGSGDYDSVVLTEMVEIKDAVKYHKSGKVLPPVGRSGPAGQPRYAGLPV